MTVVLSAIENQFAARARTPKGRKACLAIFRATRDLVAQTGTDGLSLSAVADRAGLTQAGLRHYFETRDELLLAYFTAGTQWLRDQMTRVLKPSGLSPGEQLQQCIAWHLEYMESVDTVSWLESSAYWLRRPRARRIRDDWYRWLAREYAHLISGIQPALGDLECQRLAYVVLTLVLGSWITHGRGSALSGAGDPIEQRKLLTEAAMRLVTP